ncbi:hypothetical protein R3P38DRAFT_2589566 [Favolaschia claudopus]|uniref:Uncharacterized protein n=1 Tax=Favolaschia claudopus TaxID=2862362 RepID=A0AAV9Z1P5_9AGAR
MSEASPSSSATPSRGRGRGKSRGGLGKYLRARGRGHGRGRPAEFGKRLLLEGESPQTEDDEEAAERAAEIAQKYSRRHLGTNADRYVEPEPELDSDGEPIVEPEVDLTAFLEKQRISDDTSGPSMLRKSAPEDEEDDVDHSLSHISSGAKATASRKGKVEQIEWNDDLDQLEREKVSAEAIWDLKSRFRAKSEKLRKPIGNPRRDHGKRLVLMPLFFHPIPVEAPPLPLPDGSQPPLKDPKEDMEDFLDDLLG